MSGNAYGDSRPVTGVCHSAAWGTGPGWWHWTCPGPSSPETPRYLRSDCGCWCHNPVAEAELVPVPERHLVHVPAHRRSAAEQRVEAV
ncbi:hypothetical protein [Streptomyces harbinensis]|uniref:hypothetical protein n=1 Tax=Streptomyces harbinensis TaxID=1176198 RepID=UPI0034DDECD6